MATAPIVVPIAGVILRLTGLPPRLARLDGACTIPAQYALLLAVLVPSALALAAMLGTVLARMGFPLPAPDRRLGCVDGLRGYLALSVVAHHAVIWQGVLFGGPLVRWHPPEVNILNQMGVGAVALFFMVTGFVFYPRVLSGWRANDWRAIAIGRVFRIVPLIALTVVVIVLILCVRTGRLPGPDDLRAIALWISAWSQPPLLGVVEAKYVNAGVLWSLWYEWVFYILLLPLSALAMDLVRGRVPTWTVPAVLLAACLLARGIAMPRHLEVYLPLFALGMLAFEVQARPAARRVLASRPAATFAIALFGLAVTLTHEPMSMPQLFAYALFFTVIACGNSLFGLLNLRGSLVLGECSYGIYLVHGIALSLLFTEAGEQVRAMGATGPFALLAPAMLVVVLVAAASFLLFEKPLIAAGRHLARRIAGPAVARRPAELEVAP